MSNQTNTTLLHRRLQSCLGTRARLGYAALFDVQLGKPYFVHYTYVCAHICYMLVTTCLRIQSSWYEYVWFKIIRVSPGYLRLCSFVAIFSAPVGFSICICHWHSHKIVAQDQCMGSRSHDYFVKVNNFHCWKGKCYGGIIIPPSLTERMSEAEHLTSLAKSNKLFSAVGERPLIAPVVRWGPRGNKIRSVGERPLILQLVLTQLILTQLILTCCFGGEVRTQGQQNQIF